MRGMTVGQKQKLLDFWELAMLEFPESEQQKGILIGAMCWIELPQELMEAILGARNYDVAKTLIWRL